MKHLKTLLAMMMMFAMVFTMPMGSIAAANDNTFYWATFSDPIDFNPCLAKTQRLQTLTNSSLAVFSLETGTQKLFLI